MTLFYRAVLASASLLFLTTFSNAAILLANGFALASTVVGVSGGSLSVVDSSTHNFVGKDSTNMTVFTGVETSTVYSGDALDPTDLTFVYRVSNDLLSADAINRVSVSGFSGFTTDVGYVTATGTFPVTVDRSVNGDIIGFSFPGNELLAGQTAATFVIRTNALVDLADTMSISDGGTGTTGSFGPGTSNGGGTPEPASLGLLGIGSLMLVRRRRA